jgi:tripeptidyl-peptidase-1
VSEGISEERITLSKGRNWVKFEATIEEAEYLLKTEYKVYESVDGKAKRSLATDEYSLPLTVRNHVDFITPTVHFDAILSKRSPKKRAVPSTGKMINKMNPVRTGHYTNSSAGPNATSPYDPFDLSTCNQAITTECVRALYNMPNGTLANSSIMIVEYTPNSFIPTDLEKYLGIMDPWLPSTRQPLIEFVDGAFFVNANGDDTESNLDLQLAVPLGKSLQTMTTRT